MQSYRIIKVQPAQGGSPSLEVVQVKGSDVGFIQKYRDSAHEKHPWKAHFGVGFAAKFLGSFYPSEGGKRAAIQAILNSM